MHRHSKFHTWYSKHRHKLSLILIFVIALTSIAILLALVKRIVGSDDTIFQTQIKPYASVIDWLNYRYHTWSGRIFSESFVYIFSQLPLIFWKFASLAAYGVTSVAIFSYYKLFTKKRSSSKDYVMLALAMIIPLLMETHAFFDGTLWVTGSMNYSWIMAFGLISFYPVVFYVIRNHAPHWLITVAGLLCGVIAASSQEQIGIVLSALSFALIAYWLLRTRKLSIYLLSFFAVFLCFFLIGILAPGNGLRLQAETLHWIPDFYTTPLLQRADYSFRWILDAIINHTGFLLVGSWGLLIALFAKKQNKDRLDYVFMTILTIVGFFALSKGYGIVGYWSNFYATWKPQLPSRLSYVVFLPWSIALITTVLAPIILYRNKIKGIILGILYCAAIASTAVITLSPTMYASGVRTLYVPSMLLVLILYILFENIIEKYKKSSYLFIGVVACVAISQYILLTIKLLM